jgi:hypothetical protein
MATPEIASSPPTINYGSWVAKEHTLEIKANTGNSSPKGATRPMEQRARTKGQTPIPPMKIV